MSGIGVINNPHSGKNKRNPRLAKRLAYILGEQGHMFEPDRIEALEEVARRFREHEIEVLCVNGGDGTVHRVLSAFAHVYDGEQLPMVALLRGGTMNTMARNIGLSGRPVDILGRVVAQYYTGEPFSLVERNLLVVDGRQLGFLFGNGLISTFLEAYYEGGDASPWKAVKVFARTVGSALVGGKFIRRLLRPVRVRVTADHEAWSPVEYTSVAAGTMADIGIGFRPFYAAPNHPDHIHALGFACSAMDIVKVLPRVRLALPTKSPCIIDQVCRKLVLESDDPIPYMIDGDFHIGGHTLTVEAGPRVRLITD